MSVRLRVPSEPIKLKTEIFPIAKELKTKKHPKWYNLVLWHGNKISAYIWREWSSQLRSYGFTWQKFLVFMSFHKKEVLLWINNDLNWETLAKILIESLNGPLGRLIKEFDI